MSNPNKDLEDLKEATRRAKEEARKRLVAKHEAEISELEEEDQEKRKRYQNDDITIEEAKRLRSSREKQKQR